MRLALSCVYWILLLVSVISSGLLFLIVASEGTQSLEPSDVDVDDKNFRSYENVSSENVGTYIRPLAEKTPKAKGDRTETSYQDIVTASSIVFEKVSSVSASFELGSEDKTHANPEVVEILSEGLTQQPNLSEGVSRTGGQAGALTLADTELRSLAEAGSKAGPSPNLTYDRRSVQEESNATTEERAEERAEEVLVVRAEQKTGTRGSSGGPFSMPGPPVVDDHEEEEEEEEEETASDVGAGPATPTPPELDEGTARSRLANGPGDDGAPVILDGFVPSGLADPHEDIPSFSEWAQKRLEEAEKKKAHPNASAQNPGSGPGRSSTRSSGKSSGRSAGRSTSGAKKVRSKNYASPDCGAKIVAVNPEARSARSVLASTRDEYMLNTCTTRIWFVVELCEAIQAKKIELANFELFSSSPRDFSVYVSDRFPTRDWSPVGQFTARDERDIQSFGLQPHLFGKFMKVEMHSHYGEEHFCPVSLFRAYGTSEFEVLETETENQVQESRRDGEIGEENGGDENDDDDEDEDDEDEEVLEAESGEPPRNLFGSARDAVLSIVKKAAEVLVKSNGPRFGNLTMEQRKNLENEVRKDDASNGCVTPRYNLVCNDCSEERFSKVFRLISCADMYLNSLLKIGFVESTLRETGLCSPHGFDFSSELERQPEGTRDDSTKALRSNFFKSLFAPEYVIALCNVFASNGSRLALNSSHQVLSEESESSVDENTVAAPRAVEIHPSTTFDARDTDAATATSSTTSTSDIKSSLESTTTVSLDTSTTIADCKSTGSSRGSTSSREGATASVGSIPGKRGIRAPEHESSTSSSSTEAVVPTETLVSRPGYTKTLNRDDLKTESRASIAEPVKELPEESVQCEAPTTPAPSASRSVDNFERVDVPDMPVDATPRSTISPTLTRQLELQEPREAPFVEADDKGDSLDVHSRLRLDPTTEITAKSKSEATCQESKVLQEQLNLDTLLSDLKELEGDQGSLQSNQAQNPSSAAAPTASSTPQQKESVFLRLSNRIKALERNMSLSGQYLEELSRRYKKQVEEMQRSLERAVASMNEESRRSEERESRQLEEIATLKGEIASLSEALQEFLCDRESWRSRFGAIFQHAVFACLEIAIVLSILTYRRRSSNHPERVTTTLQVRPIRRHSAEVSTNPKKTKRRRSSDVPSGSVEPAYRGHAAEHRPAGSQEGKKRRKRKRESTSLVPATTAERLGTSGSVDPPARRVSSPDAPNFYGCGSSAGRTDAAKPGEEVNGPTSCSSSNSEKETGGWRNLPGGKVSSLSTIGTALASRSKRPFSGASRSDNFDSSGRRDAAATVVGANGTNARCVAGEESDGATPVTGKKEKKTTGFRKMEKRPKS
ncbi:SUN domain-containing ossification factor isoform X2 [Orussus abietinus]|uniref:SUN domain-containing ossification factor isoform X2 n=1 Tax=Orussus abietinus TaxID=222816 RepID=UPI000626AAB6|nr:SUN domain-containing ossification factor isoform X2 [Orussus abietinus]